MGKYLDIVRRVGTDHRVRDISDQSDKSSPRNYEEASFGRFGRFGRSPQQYYQAALDALERRCPEHVDREHWQQAIIDGRRFLAQCSAALGWSARDLFGLADIPEKPVANYRRLSRYDQTGMIWLLQGAPVVAMTEEDVTGTISHYHRQNKPRLVI